MLDSLTVGDVTGAITFVGMATIIILNWSKIIGNHANKKLTNEKADATAGEMALKLAKEQKAYFDARSEEVVKKMDSLMVEILSLKEEKESDKKIIIELECKVDKLVNKVETLIKSNKDKDRNLRRWESEVENLKSIIKQRDKVIVSQDEKEIKLDKEIVELKKTIEGLTKTNNKINEN